MKTLQLGLGWFPEQGGGLDRVFYDCARHLPEVGVDFRGLVAGSENVALNSNGRIRVFAAQDAPLWQRWQGVRQTMHQMLSEETYDAIVSHFALYTFPVLTQLRKYPSIVHFHGPWALEGSVEGTKAIATWAKWGLEKLTYRCAARFIVLSEAFRTILHREYDIPLERIHVIPGGVDPELLDMTLSRYEAREKLAWPQDRPIILCVRRLVQRMGLDNAIAAIDKVRNRYPDVLLLIAGKGAMRGALQAQIDALGLSHHVRLLGFVPDEQLKLAYRAADLSVVPTVALEGFGLIVVESLAAGTPVLGTPIGGIPEILQPLSQDLVFDGHTSDLLAQGIEEALSGDRQLPDSQTCQAYVRERYIWPIVAKQIKLVYQDVLNNYP